MGAYDTVQHEVALALRQLVPSTMRIRALEQHAYHAYVPVNTDTLTDTFHADLAFRFSLGVATLWPRILTLYRGGVAQRLAEVGLHALAAGESGAETCPTPPAYVSTHTHVWAVVVDDVRGACLQFLVSKCSLATISMFQSQIRSRFVFLKRFAFALT